LRLDQLLNDTASSACAAIEIVRSASPDFEYLRSVQRRMFSRVLSWAGEVRDVDAQAVGTGIPYARPEFIQPALDELFAKLAAEDYLAGLDRAKFVRRLAACWADLSAIHPFATATRGRSRRMSATSPSEPVTRATGPASTWTASRPRAVAGDEAPLAEYSTRSPLRPVLAPSADQDQHTICGRKPSVLTNSPASHLCTQSHLRASLMD
jgi:cell filamentation protein